MRNVKANQLFRYLNDLFPQNTAEEWDKVGFQIPDVFTLPSQDYIKNVVVCMDVTSEVVDFAIEHDSNLIISRHPFIFQDMEIELNNKAKKNLYQKLVEKEIQVFSIHTNYDHSKHQSLKSLLENIFNIKQINISEENSELLEVELFEELEFEKIISNLKFIFGSQSSKLSCDLDLENSTNKFYIATGSASSIMIEKSLRKTTFITGEAKWNDFIYAKENNVNLIVLGHYMENYFIDDIQSKLNKTFNDELTTYTYDIKNMWKIY